MREVGTGKKMRQSKIINHQSIKNYNRNKILKQLSEKRQLTKHEIALETSISIPTVANNIEMLLEEGIVDEAGMARSTGGRRAMMIRFLPDSRRSFGVDVTPEKVRIVLSNLDGDFSHDESFPFVKGDFTSMINEISVRIKNIQEKNQISEENIIGIGFSLPGTVNGKNLSLEMAPNLGLKDISFSKYSKIIRYPMFIENDANAGALAELMKFNSASDVVYISIKQGVGCGIIKDGQLYRGKNQRAGEFGHMCVETQGKKCSCGRTGCWELYASNTALIDRYAGMNAGNKISIEEYVSLVKQEEPVALKALNEYLDYLAMGVENIILGIDPGAVIVGGDMALLGDIVINPLREKIFVANNFDTVDDIAISASKFGIDAPITGAAMLPIWDYLYN
jgi:predicted NBD/HSP70 family sugar kinase